MKNIFLCKIVPVAALLFFLSAGIMAAQLPVTPECELEAAISELTKNNENFYTLQLRITEIIGPGKNPLHGTDSGTCAESFAVGQTVSASFYEHELQNRPLELEKGQTIRFDMVGVMDEFSTSPGYEINLYDSNITIVKEADSQNNPAPASENSNFWLAAILLAAAILGIAYLALKRKKP